MSIDAGLYISLQLPQGLSSYDLLLTFFNGNWIVNDQNKISYLPLGDGNNYNWTSKSLEEIESVKRELKQKSIAGETLGVVLTQDGSGGNFLLYPNGEVTFSPLINRKTISDNSTTDATWYLNRILPIINSISGIKIISWSWKECG